MPQIIEILSEEGSTGNAYLVSRLILIYNFKAINQVSKSIQLLILYRITYQISLYQTLYLISHKNTCRRPLIYIFESTINLSASMSQQETSYFQHLNPQQNQIATHNQDFTQSLHESKLSFISHQISPRNLIKYFQSYAPINSDLKMEELHASKDLKLKKYKQSVYYGQFINNRRHGQGIMLYDNARVYEGKWENDYKHGIGYEKFPNGCVYQGDYVNGKPEGVGRYSWPNNEFYQGQWVNGAKHGSGLWKGQKGDSYIGEWKFGKVDGYGVHIWVNGDRYEGLFKECLKHGEGIQKFANGDIYKGLYEYGKPTGYGQYYWANGSYFKGMFRNGLRNGQGLWKKGPGNTDKYEGQYANDKKNGYGIFTWKSGNIYKGQYKADIRCGYGEMYWIDGSFYKGEWNQGVQNGVGQIYVQSEGYQRGIFANNVLIIAEKQKEPSHHKKRNSCTQFIGNKNSPGKLNFRSREFSYSSTKKNEAKSPEVSKVSKHSKVSLDNHPWLPKKFYKQREQKFMTMDGRTIKSKQSTIGRLHHSSFYLHKLSSRGAVSMLVNRVQMKSKQLKRVG